MALADLVAVSTSTLGNGTITLGPALAGFRSFAQAGLVDGAVVSYAIEDGLNRETGRGVYDATAGALTRGLLASSTGALLVLSGSARVFVTALAADFEDKADLVDGKVPAAQLPAPPVVPTFATVAEVRAGTATGKTIDPATLVDADSYIPVTANGAFTLDFSAGRKFKVTMTANSTMSITGLTKEISGVIRFQQDATGGRTLALNSAIKKVGSYTLSTAANAVDRCGVEICGGVVELTALEKGIA